ncbi:hypothetical protein QA644_23460 (plasmid) [Rhizobium sp. CC1099]|uniref:hypothetical protein n=1 Tax=Rhizobium sp. CC1099 TaxID=3039160 RepID=UPI0024B1D742|nr:hypothetical protein [Rhizobium sp. CC1099]WFU91170.1 hypothetical protein QA644_23460 [Rhizobium sp. CC1099]
MMQYLALGLPDHQSELDLPLADDIKFGDTGLVTKYRKAEHRFTFVGAPFMAIGSLWREGESSHPASCTTDRRPEAARWWHRLELTNPKQDFCGRYRRQPPRAQFSIFGGNPLLTVPK